MLVLTSQEELRHYRATLGNNRPVGFVPTMGALHQGHVSLLDRARSESDILICSIFVNPAQFNNSEDLTNYPRTLEPDLEMCRSAGVDAVFTPSVAQMYPQEAKVRFEFGTLEQTMEGAHRPGHFSGVALIVSKLFHLVQPGKAYFGQKDLQQFCIIRQLVQDLGFELELECCPTLREADGLAMSSRNVRLTAEERALAPEIYRALTLGAAVLRTRGPEAAQNAVLEHLHKFPAFQPDYVNVVDAFSLQPLTSETAQVPAALCVAALLGPVRLIDNVLVK